MAANTGWRGALTGLRDRISNSWTSQMGIRRDGNWTWADTGNLVQSILTSGVAGVPGRVYDFNTRSWFGRENPTGPGYGVAFGEPDMYAGPPDNLAGSPIPTFTDWQQEAAQYSPPPAPYWTRGSGRGSARTAGARTISGGNGPSSAGALEAERATGTMSRLANQSQQAMNQMFGRQER